MDLDPASLLLFARVADSGSFSRTAERFGLPKSTVSRRITELERRIGERLLLRTTRKLSLTDFGHHLLVHARQMAEELDAAASLALHRQSRPSGRLRVSLPSDAPVPNLPQLFAEFLRLYPDISLELDISARRVDLIGEGYDLAIRMGELSDDATLVARRLFQHGWGLYASPDYLALRGSPPEPQALRLHDGLALRGRGDEPMPWRLSQGASKWEGLPRLRATVNSPSLLARLIEQGLGIGPLPEHQAEAAVRNRRLVRVLPQWRLPEAVGWAVMPGRRLLPEKTRVFLEMLGRATEGCDSSSPHTTPPR